MAHVTSNSNGTTPFMDRLTHAVIKETSKSLKYYIDVKRRENGFVLNPNSSAYDSAPLKARFIYGTTKEYPPLYGSYHSDNDVKLYFNSLKQTSQQKYRSSHSSSNSPEKQMCRNELNYHMRSHKYAPDGGQKFNELRLGPGLRASSSCSRLTTSDPRRQTTKSAFKSPRNERDHLIDDAASILATMVKTRRSTYSNRYLSEQIPPSYDSQNTNPSPRPIDEQSETSNHRSSDAKPSLTNEQSREEKEKRNLERAAIIIRNAKPVKRSILCDYKVTIRTGNCNGASTNAPIRLKFYGTHGYTDFSPLANSQTHRVPFLKDQIDIFTIQTDHVGQLVGIAIGHDKKDIQASWFLSYVSIEDPIRETVYEIPCNSWLSNTSVDQKTMRDFQVVSMKSLNENKTSHKRREETSSQSSSSSTTTARSKSTTHTNSSQNNQSKGHKQRTSVASTTDLNNHTKEISKSKTTKERVLSPPISSISSSDHELEKAEANKKSSSSSSSSSSSTPSPTFDQQTPRNNNLQQHDSADEHPRPPARLEKRASPVSVSPERPIRSREETNESKIHDFFE